MSAPKEVIGEASKSKHAKATNKTVLVVEDFDETRSMLRILLEMSGYYVVEAIDGQQAIEVAEREHPDLILMDIGLPVLDGFAATRSIRNIAELREVPIVAVTAHGTAEYRVKALAAGCNEFITKPVDFAQLQRLVSSLIQLRGDEHTDKGSIDSHE